MSSGPMTAESMLILNNRGRDEVEADLKGNCLLILYYQIAEGRLSMKRTHATMRVLKCCSLAFIDQSAV